MKRWMWWAIGLVLALAAGYVIWHLSYVATRHPVEVTT